MKNILNNIKIQAIAAYLPSKVLEMRSLADIYGEKTVETIIQATGVERVHVAASDETSSDMCFEAAIMLIEEEGISRENIDGLIFASQTSDYRLPATSIILQDRLGLTKETVCFDLPYGCSGYIYGIFQASLLISSGTCKNVLVLAGDTSTKMINAKDRAQRMVFGDCGTATLVVKGNNTIGIHMGVDGSGYDKVIIPAGGSRIPSSEATQLEFSDDEGNIRTQENLYMDGLSVFNFILQSGKSSINSLLEYMNWNKEDVNLFALHQGTSFTLRHLIKRLKVDPEKAPINIVNYGNTGPSTIPLILCDMFHSNPEITSKWDKIIMCAYGVGLSWGSIACSLSETNIYKPKTK